MQKHVDGCVIACFAMVMGVSYDKALKAVHPKRKKGKKIDGIPFVNLIKILNKLHIHIAVYPFSRNILKIQRPAILLMNQQGCDWSHVVVWDPESKKILDPDRKKRCSFEYYQKELEWYLEVL